MDDMQALLDRMHFVESMISAQSTCTRYKDILLEIEKVRGEIRVLGERERVRDGMTNSQVSRLVDRLDRQQQENKELRQAVDTQDHIHTSGINKINMNLKYTLGVFAALVFLLNFFDKIREFVSAMIGVKP